VLEQGIIGNPPVPRRHAVFGSDQYPLNETFTTLIPPDYGNRSLEAAASGVVYSPLLEAFRDAFPKGVVNIVYGNGRK